MITEERRHRTGADDPPDRRGGQADRTHHPDPALLGGAGPRSAPAATGAAGERLYSATDMARVTRIRDLQELLGFSLAEVRVVLDTEDIDVLDRVRSEFRWGDASPDRRRELLDEAIAANDQLLEPAGQHAGPHRAFRDERAAKSIRLNEVRGELDRSPALGTARVAPTVGPPT